MIHHVRICAGAAGNGGCYRDSISERDPGIWNSRIRSRTLKNVPLKNAGHDWLVIEFSDYQTVSRRRRSNPRALATTSVAVAGSGTPLMVSDQLSSVIVSPEDTSATYIVQSPLALRPMKDDRRAVRGEVSNELSGSTSRPSGWKKPLTGLEAGIAV